MSLKKVNKELIVSQTQIENRIFTIRGIQVMLDSDLYFNLRHKNFWSSKLALQIHMEGEEHCLLLLQSKA